MKVFHEDLKDKIVEDVIKSHPEASEATFLAIYETFKLLGSTLNTVYTTEDVLEILRGLKVEFDEVYRECE